MIKLTCFLPVAALCACSGQIAGDRSDRGGRAGGADGALGGDLPPDESSPFGDDAPLENAPGNAFACRADAPQVASPMRRLTRLQYENTMRDLVSLALGSELAAESVMKEVESVLATRPTDVKKHIGVKAEGLTFRRLDQDVSLDHVESGYEIAKAVATRLVDGERLQTVIGACMADQNQGNDRQCLAAFVRDWGARAQRRPLTDVDVEFYLRYTLGEPEGERASIVKVIAGLLASPRVSYLVEHGEGDEADGSSARLTPFEVASRLSYQLWDTMPDEELWQHAADGSLMMPDVAKAQFRRLLSDPRGHETMKRFVREWLRVDELPVLEGFKDQAVYKAFARGIAPGADLRDAMVGEIDELVARILLDAEGRVVDLFTTEALFPGHKDLATIYETDLWEDGGDPRFGDRRGILTRAALLTTSGAKTHPILRGVFIRGTVLCDVIADPPANAPQDAPDVEPTMSGRQVVEAITEQPGTSCAGCHQAYINPIGYALERYDSLGRVRTEEAVLDEKTGAVLATHPIDSSVVPAITDGDMIRIDSDAELMDLIAASHKVEACLARQLFRFTSARREDEQADGCSLERTRRAFTMGSFEDGWLAILTDGAFWRRTF